MDEILAEFQSESKELVAQLLEILESIEGDYSQHHRLEEYGQVVDRIMGTAKSLALAEPSVTVFGKIGSYGELCKLVSYKASQVGDNESLYTVVVALLLDATEMLQDMVDQIGGEPLDVKEFLSETFLDRLRWVSQQFDENLRSTVAVTPSAGSLAQTQIDALLKQLGVGS